jgi:hypothetical protein
MGPCCSIQSQGQKYLPRLANVIAFVRDGLSFRTINDLLDREHGLRPALTGEGATKPLG